MTNVQLYLATGVPIIAILVSMSLRLIQISSIREDIRTMRSEFRDDLRSLRGEIREELRALRADLNTLTGKVIEIENRLS